MILTDDPQLIRAMTSPRSGFRRGHWYRGMRLDPRINNTLSEQDEGRHTALRAKLLPGYTGKDIPCLETRIDERVLELVAVLEKYVKTSQTVDFAHLAQYLALDVLTDLAFGRPVGYLAAEEDLYEYINKSADFLPIMELGTNHPWINKILSSRLMQYLAAPKASDRTGLGALIGIAQKAIQARYDNKCDIERRPDMLDSFKRRGLSRLEAESESLLQILAGKRSTTSH
jgi:cytochrome P450